MVQISDLFKLAGLLAILLSSGCSSLSSKSEAEAEPKAVEPQPVEQVKEEEPVVQTMPVTKNPEPIAEPLSKNNKNPVSSVDIAGLKKGPNEYVITLKEKVPSHPMYGQGHSLGFVMDGEAGKEIYLRRGESYVFHVRTDPLHDVYLATNPIGWGGGVLSAGVTGNFTFNGEITFKPNKETPDVIYYQCQNHKSMGWRIHVLDKGAALPKIKKHKPKKAKTKSTNITEKQAKQKISFAKMMVMSKTSKGIIASDNAIAKQTMLRAQKELSNSEAALKKGDNALAFDAAEEAMRLYKEAKAAAPNVKLGQSGSKPRYKELLSAVRDFKESHQEAYDRTVKQRGKSAAVAYDEKTVDKHVKDAKALAMKKQYADAAKILVKAERLITVAINGMMDSQTVVYDKNFETPKEEYEFELGRFDSYYELIPIGIEQKKPGAGAIKLMKNFSDKGLELRVMAVKAASEKNYKDAILMLQAGTDKVKKGLRFIGIR